MTDYIGIILNGLFTGIGVILAHEAWDYFKGYRTKIGHEIKKNLEDRL